MARESPRHTDAKYRRGGQTGRSVGEITLSDTGVMIIVESRRSTMAGR